MNARATSVAGSQGTANALYLRRRLMNVIASNRLDLGVLVTHQRKLDDIVEAYDLFSNQRDGVLKIAIKP